MEYVIYYIDRSGDILEISKPTNKIFERYTKVNNKYHGLYECFYENGDICTERYFNMGKVTKLVEYWPGRIVRLIRN